MKQKDCGAHNEESEDSDNENKDDSIIKQDMSSGTYGYEGDTHTYTDATDGTVYFWDREKNAWFPKVKC
jgi:HIV Tat-specific factor 1